MLSHRWHDLPLAGARLELDRGFFNGAVLRRVELRGLIQDERLTVPALGAGATTPAARVSIVLDGELRVYDRGRETRLRTGDAAWVSAAVMARAGDCEILEIDWSSASATTPGVVHLSPAALSTARRVSSALRRARTDTIDELTLAFTELARSLRAEGIDVPATPALRDDLDAGLLGAVDRTLTPLDRSPMLVDLEAESGLSRRTLARRVPALNAGCGMRGHRGQDWRSMRDFYRLLVSTIVLSHRDATPRSVARMVGYGSTEALDHAYREVRLPAPSEIASRLRRW